VRIFSPPVLPAQSRRRCRPSFSAPPQLGLISRRAWIGSCSASPAPPALIRPSPHPGRRALALAPALAPFSCCLLACLLARSSFLGTATTNDPSLFPRARPVRRPQKSVVFTSRRSFGAHLHNSHHHDGQVYFYFSPVLADRDRPASHRRVRHPRSHRYQGMRSSNQHAVQPMFPSNIHRRAASSSTKPMAPNSSSRA